MPLTGEKRLIAPCGLYCGTCAFYRESEIRKTAIRMGKMLAGFKVLAKMYEDAAPELKDYPKFARVLDYLTKQNCRSCRLGGGTAKGPACQSKECPIIVCLSRRGVDFCFECSKFPCEEIPAVFKAQSSDLAKIWLGCNKEMKRKGLDRYLKKKKNEPRYDKLGG